MYRWALNGHYRRSTLPNGWTVALIGGAVGMLIAGAWWWMQRGTASTALSRRQADLRRLGQAPSRSHIQLFPHPARQEQPR
jgi:hypothetical protein